jgi:RimJ/RimL family protein N-acetyltransferase
LRAERLAPHHFDELRRMHTDAAVMQELGGVKTHADTESYLDRNLAHWDEHGFGLWIVYALEGHEPIGRAVLRHLSLGAGDWTEIEVGYAFYEPWWGQGLATEVTLACLNLGFHHLHCDSIVAVTSPANSSSQHVLTKCGLVFEREVTLGGAPMSLFRIRES